MKSHTFLLKLFVACSVIIPFGTLQAMEKKEADKIKIITSDNVEFRLEPNIALQSGTFRNMLKAEPTEEAPQLPTIRSEVFYALVALMNYVHNLDLPEEQKQQILEQGITERGMIEQIGQQIDRRVRIPGAKIDVIELAKAIDFLEIKTLEAPITDYISKTLSTNPEAATNYITTHYFELGPDIQELLAKYWYLNHGQNRNFILPDLAYGFSIQELLNYGKLPQITEVQLELQVVQRKLNLKNFRINSLIGLNAIPEINTIDFLDLDSNRLTQLPENIFNNLPNLYTLWLQRNQLTQLPVNIFNNLPKLRDLDLFVNQLTQLHVDIFNNLTSLGGLCLSFNQLTQLPVNIFNNLPNLESLNLSGNPLPQEYIDQLRRILPTTAPNVEIRFQYY